jgi:hypothetical protein
MEAIPGWCRYLQYINVLYSYYMFNYDDFLLLKLIYEFISPFLLYYIIEFYYDPLDDTVSLIDVLLVALSMKYLPVN